MSLDTSLALNNKKLRMIFRIQVIKLRYLILLVEDFLFRIKIHYKIPQAVS